MTKREFQELFLSALELAAVNAEKRLGRGISRNFQILLHGAGSAGVLIEPSKSLEKLFINENLFYRIIDVAVVETGTECTKVFVRVSQHAPTEFNRTWNSPPGSGPFKQILAEGITVTSEP